MARLRGPGGCPWDIDQDHQSIAQCLVDECSELLETIDKLDMEHMLEELGDVLLQVVFHAQMASEAGYFDFHKVAGELNEKLIRRHPHVFGDEDSKTPDQAFHHWEKIKAQEKRNHSRSNQIFKELPPSLPALLFAYDIYKRIQKEKLPTGDRVDQDAIDSLANELDEEAAGKLLFDLVAACRLKGIDPESAVRRHARRVQEETEILYQAQQP